MEFFGSRRLRAGCCAYALEPAGNCCAPRVFPQRLDVEVIQVMPVVETSNGAAYSICETRERPRKECSARFRRLIARLPSTTKERSPAAKVWTSARCSIVARLTATSHRGSPRTTEMASARTTLGRLDLIWSCCARGSRHPRRAPEFVARTLDLFEPGRVSVHTTEL